MLWHKGWLETRYKLVFVLGFIVFILCELRMPQHGTAKMVPMIFQVTVPVFVMAFCSLLAGAGIATQPPLQATKGLQGSMLFTLSLPVTRLRLLAICASIGRLEMAGLVSLLCTAMWIISPPLRELVSPFEMVEYAATLIVCASSSTACSCCSPLSWTTNGACG